MSNADSRYEYEEDGEYCYAGTNVLINKLGITNSIDLQEAERRITAIKTTQIDQEGLFFDGSFDTKHLQDIHRFLFEDIYEWAGIRAGIFG